MVSVMLYPCIVCVALLMNLFVLCVACLTVNCLVKQHAICLVKQFAICLGVIAIFSIECVFTFPVRTECGMFVMYRTQCCMSVSAVL